jgi:hypothetical protein
MRLDRLCAPLALALVAAACGGDDRTLDPGAVGDDVVIKVTGTVVAASDLSALGDVSVWVDVETAEGSDPRATAHSNAEGRFSMVFTERDCSLATELAFRAFARKKGFRDGALTSGGNGGLPVLKCVTREQEIVFQLATQ